MSDDWTQARNGRTNSSPVFLALVDEVARLIRGSAHSLIAGDTESVARLVMAQLAHVHGLRPGPGFGTGSGKGRVTSQKYDQRLKHNRDRRPKVNHGA